MANDPAVKITKLTPDQEKGVDDQLKLLQQTVDGLTLLKAAGHPVDNELATMTPLLEAARNLKRIYGSNT